MSTTTYDHELIRLLGTVDGLFWPTREWSENRPVMAAWYLRADYLKAGLPIRSDKADPIERQRQHRLTGRWENAGLVSVTKRSGSRSMWRLADSADWALRRLCGQYTFWATVAAMMCVDGFARLGAVHEDTEDGVAEFELAGTFANPALSERCQDIAERLLPALCRGWVGANSDREGKVAYSVLDAGREVLADPERFEPADGIEYDPAAADIYNEAFERSLDETTRAKLTKVGALAIPLNAGSWGGPYTDRRLIPFRVFTRTGKFRGLNTIWRAYRRLTSS